MSGMYMEHGELRKVALAHAMELATTAMIAGSPSEIVEAAELFYTFLVSE